MNSGAVDLRGVELRRLDLELRTPHSSSLGTTSRRPVIVVRLDTGHGDGWGECAALPAPDYSDEYVDGAWSMLCEFLVPALLDAARSDSEHGVRTEDVAGILSTVRGNAMAKACLEMAVLDSELRPQGRSLADRLGAVRDEVECGAVVALVRQEGHGGQKDPLDMIKGLVDEGYRRVKVKIAPGADLELLSAVRHAFPILSIQADANGSYSLDDASHLRSLESLDDLDLLCLEQPLNPDDLLGHSKLAEILDTPICLDESITSLGRIRDAIALSACDVICIKPARLGGFLQAARAHDICAAAGIPVFCGGMLETNFARCANAALAALPGFTLPGDLQVGNRFAEPDPFGVGSGIGSPTPATIGVYRGPGVGPAPDMELLDRITARSLYLRI